MSGVLLSPYEKVMASVVRADSGCLEWVGKTVQNGGYSCINIGPADKRKKLRGHRVVFEHHNGPIPDGMHVCHRCDNPPCVEIAHLFLGTAKDNMQDKSRKGRARGPGMLGEKHHASKLTADSVRAIRSKYEAMNGRRGALKELADEFGVRYQSIRAVVRRESWKELDCP